MKNTYDKLIKKYDFSVDVFEFEKQGDCVVEIVFDGDKIVLAGKYATTFIDLISSYLEGLQK